VGNFRGAPLDHSAGVTADGKDLGQAQFPTRLRAWQVTPVGREIIQGLTNAGIPAGLAERAVSKPTYEMSAEELKALANHPVPQRVLDLVRNELSRAAGLVAQRGDARLATTARNVVAAMPTRIDAFGAKMLWDLAQRLPTIRDQNLQAANVIVPRVGANSPNDRIVEFTVSFDAVTNSGDTPLAGYRGWFSTSARPDAAGAFDKASVPKFEMGLVRPNSLGLCFYHHVDTAGQFANATRYYVWGTAFNTGGGESVGSNFVAWTALAVQRADMNADGVIDYADVDRLLRILMGQDDPLARGDVNGDGVVNMADVDALVARIRGT